MEKGMDWVKSIAAIFVLKVTFFAGVNYEKALKNEEIVQLKRNTPKPLKPLKIRLWRNSMPNRKNWKRRLPMPVLVSLMLVLNLSACSSVSTHSSVTPKAPSLASQFDLSRRSEDVKQLSQEIQQLLNTAEKLYPDK